MRSKFTRRANSQDERGFSFVELLVALAITSILMLVFLQSVQGMFRLSARASEAAEATVGRTLQLRQFQRVVGGLIPSWPERIDEVFVGDAAQFSGLTRAGIDAAHPKLTPVAFRLDDTGEEVILAYKSDRVEWRLATFSGETGGFAYLGADGVWRDSWPPAENPEPGPFNDADFFPTPQLPLAVRMTTGDEVWIAAISSSPRLPVRERDLFGE